MFRYYLACALQNLRRNKLYAFISIAGLTLGLCAALLIGLYVEDELSYDRWIPGHQNIFRLTAGTLGGPRGNTGPSDTGLWLEIDYPQIKEVTRMFPSPAVISQDELEFNETIFWVDESFFRVFELPVISGSLDLALDQPDSIVINRSTAEKYFNDVNVIGEYLQYNREQALRITAVIEDLPSNTHLDFDILGAGHATFSPAAEQDRNPVSGAFGRKLWGTRTYIRLDESTPLAPIVDDLPAMLDRHLPTEGDGRKNSETYRIDTLPIADLHLSSPDASQEAVDLRGIYTVAAIGLLIILAATINFVNLMTALGNKRAREVAIRKTLGANRNDLFNQFMFESFLYVSIAAICALIFSYFLLPVFNGFLLRTISFDVISNGSLLAGTVLITLLTGMLAGIYPSLVLSNFSPGQVFQVAKVEGGVGRIRQVLSVVQFAILSILLIATYTIYQQAQFGIREALDQSDDPVIVITSSCEEPLKQALLQLPSVLGAACTFQIPQWGIGPGSSIGFRGQSDSFVSVRYTSVDVGYFELYGIKPIAGRLFEEDRAGDIAPADNIWNVPESIVIRESTSRKLGFDNPQDAIGQLLGWLRLYRLPNTFTPFHDAEIVGVIEDFQIGSVRNNTSDAVFYVQRDQSRLMSVKVSGDRLADNLDEIDELWREFGRPGPIARTFYDEVVENMYQSITRQSQLIGIYTGVAVFIAILGLFGMAAFLAEKRTKEIGIRKVVGGSRLDIIGLLLWQFSKPVALSNLIAWPVSFYFLSLWLAEFERHVSLQWWVFLGAGAVTMIIALITVFTHAYKIAGIDPVQALRYE